jgi:outer membrane protein assembly factor BamB
MWEHKTHGKVVADTVIARLFQDERQYILVGGGDGRFHTLSADGRKVWSFDTGGPIVAPVCTEDLNSDGALDIVLGSTDGNVYALSADGALLWTHSIGSWAGCTPAVLGPRKRVVAGGSDGSLMVLSSEGDFSSKHAPGISGIVDQGGYQDFVTTGFGELTCKRLCSLQLEGAITGVVTAGGASDFLAVTDKGFVGHYLLEEGA